MDFDFRASSGEDQTIVLEKKQGEYFRSFVANPDHPVHTTEDIQKAHKWQGMSKARRFMHSNSLDEKGFSAKRVNKPSRTGEI